MWRRSFLLELDDGVHVLVEGELWLTPLVPLDEGDLPRIRRLLELPDALLLPDDARVCTCVLEPGRRATISGEVHLELRPDEGGYREAQGQTLRGSPGRPLIVQRLN
jgi:hypothetical protein